METFMASVFVILVVLRFISLVISRINERRLKKMGAVEYGKANSALLVLAHLVYYGCALIEGGKRGAFFYDGAAYTGLALYAFSIIMLYYVIYSLRHVWTVKLIIAPKAHHVINRSPLFRYLRHPNYFLNVIPELAGIAVFLHAWYTLALGMAIYAIPLTVRIIQEEKVMKAHFSDY